MPMQPMWKIVSFIDNGRAAKRQWRVRRANQFAGVRSATVSSVRSATVVSSVRSTNSGWSADTFRPLTHVRMQIYIYMSIPFNAYSNDQTRTNWGVWGASTRGTIMADQSVIITLKDSPLTQTACHMQTWISMNLIFLILDLFTIAA